MRAEFVTLGHADHYAALRLTLLDSNQGVVDKLTLRFKDVWGKQKIPNNPYLRDGVDPHIWVDGDRIDWYAYHPPWRTTGSSGKWPATMWRLFAFKSRQKTTDQIGVHLRTPPR